MENLSYRPWLRGAALQRVLGNAVVRWDLYASTWIDAYGTPHYFFEVISRGEGTKDEPLSYDAFEYDAMFGRLTPARFEDKADNASDVYWTRDTRRMFNVAHGRLLRLIMIPRGYRYKSVKVHYVKALDIDPHPRGFVNHYKEPIYTGRRPGRPKGTTREALLAKSIGERPAGRVKLEERVAKALDAWQRATAALAEYDAETAKLESEAAATVLPDLL